MASRVGLLWGSGVLRDQGLGFGVRWFRAALSQTKEVLEPEPVKFNP